MKLKKLIGLLILILVFGTVLNIIVPKNVQAASESYTLGITNIRETLSGKSGGGAYGIGGLKSGESMPNKKVWKIVSYTGSGSTIDYSNAFYCLKAEHGFVSNERDVTQTKKTYNQHFDMKTDKQTVISKLNKINETMHESSTTLSNEDYNKILWILDNMYLPKSSTEAEKTALMKATEIDQYDCGVLLTDDDIEVVQQMALWYYTNPNDQNYHKTTRSNGKGPDLGTIYFNNWTGEDKEYKSLEDLYNDNVQNVQLGQKRQYQMEDLFQYYINTAETKTAYEASATNNPLTMSKDAKLKENTDSFIVGPFKIEAEQGRQYDITTLKFVDENGSDIPLNGENKLLDYQKQPLQSTDLKSLIGQEFYISLPLGTEIQQVTLKLEGTYKARTLTYYTTAANEENNDQPVVLVEEKPISISDSKTVHIVKINFDLSLKKFISKIGETAKDRKVTVSKNEDGSLKYELSKEALEVAIGNHVTYTIRVYNEGDVAGYAKEITDSIPAGLKFLPNDTTNKKYEWKMIDKDGKVTQNAEEAVKVTTDYLSKAKETDDRQNKLEAFKKGENTSETNPSHKDVEIVFEVIGTKSGSKTLTNIAEITANTNENGEDIRDRDSIPGNSGANDKEGNIPGKGTNNPNNNEDDTDVENVVLKYFDLSLKKFITAVNTGDISNRIPTPRKAADGSIIYDKKENAVKVKNGDTVVYTIRVYNEGDIAGYAEEIIDSIPEGLEFLPNDETINKVYGWKMVKENGEETDQLEEAVKVKTDYLSKAKGGQDPNKNLINAFNESGEVTATNPAYKDVKIAFKVVAKNSSGLTLTNIAEISDDADVNGDEVTDRDSLPGNSGANDKEGDGPETGINNPNNNEDDTDTEKVELKDFDLNLKKFATAVNEESISSRIPDLSIGADGNIVYVKPNVNLKVKNGDVIVFTLRVYNEGEIAGYAKEITEDIPEGLEFLPNDETINKLYGWKMIDANGEETEELEEAVKVKTDYLSKEKEPEGQTGKNLLQAYDESLGITPTNPDYKDVKIAFKVVAKNSSGLTLTNLAEITEDTDEKGEPVDDKDSTPGNSDVGDEDPKDNDEDDTDTEKMELGDFDLNLKKFITAVNEESISSRIPKLSAGTNGNITYEKSNETLKVKNGDVIVFTLRVYNEGEIAGYAEEITEDLPEGLEFLPDDETINKLYGWKMIDANGEETEELEEAVKVTTDYLSKGKEPEDQEGKNLLQAFEESLGITTTNPDYRDVKIAFKVVAKNSSGLTLTNLAEITEDADEKGEPVDDKDSTPGNSDVGDEDPKDNDEDDTDTEKVELKDFDLSLRKFITKVGSKNIDNREPNPTMGEDGNIKYNHSKEPLPVLNGKLIIYTLRVYNEGEIAGYAEEVTDNIPEGLEFLPDDETNKLYGWKMIDENGEETKDVAKAVKVTTDYLSAEKETEEGQNLIKAFNKSEGITATNPDYKDVKIAFKVTKSNIEITNIAEITDDADENGNPVDDKDSIPGNSGANDEDGDEPETGKDNPNNGEDDTDTETIKPSYFDLSLKKFITQVDDLSVNNRVPTPELNEDGEITYKKQKDPVKVENGNTIIYTLRVYNEGDIAGYAKEVTDTLNKNLQFLPDNETNKLYGWKMIDEDGEETEDVEKAVKVTTDYLSKEKEAEEGQNLIKAFNKSEGITDTNPDYRDVKIALKVINPTTESRVLENIAEITDDTDDEGDPVEDKDSTPGNEEEDEDDQDKEEVEVKYFDLSLKKWVTKVTVTENGKDTVTETGYTGDENPEVPVKVDIKSSKINKVKVKFEYKIKVTNEGEIEGYAKEIKEYIPQGLKFVKEQNPDWSQNEDGSVTTTKLENTLLKPGESAEVGIVLEWKGGNENLNTHSNIAEISKDENKSHTPDKDSTPDNKPDKPDEDDTDKAEVIIGVRTGQTKIYFMLTGIILLSFASGVFLIRKYVL